MAKFIEVLRDGLTVSGKVCQAGERVQVREDFPLVSKKKQSKRGAPRYRQITEADFKGTGGEVAEEGSLLTPAPEAVGQPVEGDEDTTVEDIAVETITAEDKFAAVAGLNIEDTLFAVSAFSEDDLAEFIAYEQAGQARVGVLEPLGIGDE